MEILFLWNEGWFLLLKRDVTGRKHILKSLWNVNPTFKLIFSVSFNSETSSINLVSRSPVIWTDVSLDTHQPPAWSSNEISRRSRILTKTGLESVGGTPASLLGLIFVRSQLRIIKTNLSLIPHRAKPCRISATKRNARRTSCYLVAKHPLFSLDTLGEFVSKWKHLIDDYFLYSYNLLVWSNSETVRRTELLVIVRVWRFLLTRFRDAINAILFSCSLRCWLPHILFVGNFLVC